MMNVPKIFLPFSLAFLGLITCSAQSYLVEIEAETATLTDDWIISSDKAGASSGAYLIWTGGLAINPVPASSALTYTFDLEEAGDYRFYIRGTRIKGQYQCPPDAENDKCNDLYTKIDGGQWTKKMVKGPWGNWFWNGNHEPGSSVVPAVYTLAAGTHTLKVTGRSRGVHFDAIIFEKANVSGPNNSYVICAGTPEDCNTATSVDQEIEAGATRVYPNPFSSGFTVETDLPTDQVTLYSITGEEIPVHILRQAGFLELSMADLPRGIYLLKLGHQVVKVRKD